MTDRSEEVLAILAAILVVFVAMLDPRISVGLAVVLLVGYTVYSLTVRPER